MDGDLTRQTKERPGEPKGRARRLVNEFQRGFPLSPRPFRDVAARLDWSEAAVLDALTDLVEDGVVSRVGPVIRPNTVGVSALAAMAVPAARLEEVAGLVSRRPEVNHNYEREHRFNLWFVLAAGDQDRLEATVRRIEAESGLPVMVLPMLDDYYIDLGFDLDGGRKPRHAAAASGDATVIDDVDRRLLAAIQDGLPLSAEPYAEVAAVSGIDEDEILSRLGDLIQAGVIKRFGVIVRHYECGYRHNAMVVWDVPDDAVHAAGRRLAEQEAVRLCYRRPRRLPDWPYNLFCMVHGSDRDGVRTEVERASVATGLANCRRDILFSVRRFKQRGARYDFGLDNHSARSDPA
ncbi:MAG: Lrp/AsnC family transcriptional regulator [Gammaproteobacteria bacterium]|nr:Lrp/AsnC family transcriptional regulator [Gammaproteobacteria bacterium]